MAFLFICKQLGEIKSWQNNGYTCNFKINNKEKDLGGEDLEYNSGKLGGKMLLNYCPISDDTRNKWTNWSNAIGIA